jgi:tetratricopeptide (TPR) repeat protein
MGNPVPRLFLFLAVAVVAVGQGTDPAYSALEKAYEAARAKDYDRAIAAFQQAAELAPNRSSIRRDLAYTLLKIGATEAARDQFAEAMLLDPTDEQGALEYAFLCYETKQPVIARRIFDRIRKTGNATAARAFENIDRPLREEIARWTQALQLSPDNFSAHEELARLAERRDELELAAEHYEKAWRLRPNRRDLLLDLGRVWKEEARIEDSNAALLAASRGAEPRVAEEARELLPPRYPYVYEFQKALALDPSNVTLRRELAYLHAEMGNQAEAEKEFQAVGDEPPQTLRTRPEEPRTNVSKDAKQLGQTSFEKGYLLDALKYLRVAHENDPVDFNVMLKLGWAYNMLKDDGDAMRWFSLARHSPDPAIAAEATRAYHNLKPALERFRTTVWVFPMFSTRWHDAFAYAQAKTELRVPNWFVRPYVSVRLIADTRGAVGVAGIGPQYLSERSVILGAGLATATWQGMTGWFEAGEALRYTPAPRDPSRVVSDYRGGLSYAKGFGRLLGSEAHGPFAETSDDGVFVSRFSNDTLLYSQNRTGYTLHNAQLYWNWNATVDALGQYWANYVETGPGFRFRVRVLLFSVNLLRGAYLINQGNPRGPNFNDLRVGIWYAFTR